VTLVLPPGAIRLEVGGREIARNNREILLKHGQRGFMRRRGPHAGSNVGLS
jgi:hypothetical protein